MDFERMLSDLANVQRTGIQAGAAVAERDARCRERAVLIAYDKALADPQTVIPSYLMAAIESLR